MRISDWSSDVCSSDLAVAIAEQEDTWAPIAGRLMTWVNLERDARLSDDTVKALDAAKKWVAAHAAELRNQRLEPIAEQAREIWSELRQESNVDIRTEERRVGKEWVRTTKARRS